MGKDPAVLFYTSDFLSGTSFFSMEERGQYITLLCEQHQLGFIPEDHFLQICGSLNCQVSKKFEQCEHGFFNQRMKIESDKRRSFCESRRNTIQKRYNKSTYVPTYVPTYVGHTNIRMENENENRNRTDIINENENIKKQKCPRLSEINSTHNSASSKKKQVIIPEHLQEIWPDYLLMRKSIKKPATDRAQRNVIAELGRLSPNDLDGQIGILEQSITETWQGVFPIKDKIQKKPLQKSFGRQEITFDELRDQAERIDLSCQNQHFGPQ